MKIITWNCNLQFAKKFEHLEPMNADICIIQECEKLKEDYFPNAKFFWTGRIENKGLGVLIKNGSASLDSIHNPNLINFLPISSDDLKILGVWAYNHRAKKFGDDVSGETIQAIEFYKEWLVGEDLPCIFGGDFNNSVIWDTKNTKTPFQRTIKRFDGLGLTSAYHSDKNEQHGSETEGTLFHTKKEEKRYHIDYLFLRQTGNVTVGSYQDWIEFSDHVPVTVDY